MRRHLRDQSLLPPLTQHERRQHRHRVHSDFVHVSPRYYLHALAHVSRIRHHRQLFVSRMSNERRENRAHLHRVDIARFPRARPREIQMMSKRIPHAHAARRAARVDASVDVTRVVARARASSTPHPSASAPAARGRPRVAPSKPHRERRADARHRASDGATREELDDEPKDAQSHREPFEARRRARRARRRARGNGGESRRATRTRRRANDRAIDAMRVGRVARERAGVARARD
mmetsp:Transcript_2312/g.9076  ORF Transcript_2312/g.9076 Transcript_2312/m.9076 type:complete len:235 (-) Transcript_2312:55-759(-)